ncbi:TonB family protein [Sulfurisoma sediminicola]|uniref:Protein TonB n=1 Tax=Sulfurisoma sediminicola TaxID=1381557 RepID=A0A497XI51_9PROT|nr:TonB family protein [Sulfurisoma sediminicola]RLJ67521.1 protein TonB [Sulfurisoma sediminicola]
MWRALAISLVLHAWMLANGWPQFVPQHAAGVLQATLRPLSAASPLAVSDMVPAEVPAPLRPAKAPLTGRDRADVSAVLPAPGPVVVAASVAAAATASSTAAPADRSPAVAGRPAGAAGNGAGQGGEGADADGLRQYRLALAREARRFKRYPERALLAGIGGTAEVRVEQAAGAFPVARLARSSGDEALDAAALDMMREAAPRTTIPEPLRGRSFAVSLPVIFDASAE